MRRYSSLLNINPSGRDENILLRIALLESQ